MSGPPSVYEDVVVNWGLRWLGFSPFEIERRRFLDRYHYLIVPRFYSASARLQRDRAILVEGWERADAFGMYRRVSPWLRTFVEG